jgi:cysteine-rich repeat protein
MSADTDICGNGDIDADEACDGSNLGGQSCDGLGYTGGTLTCGADCQLDVGGCVSECGNGQREPDEVCDGDNVGEQTCQSVTGHDQGVLACAGDCGAFDSSGCHTCGDGVAEGPEACDDGNMTDCDGCRGDCSAIEAGCGDGYSCGTEACDDGNADNTDACPDTCEAAACGDGHVWADHEVCDDGNNDDCDGCRGDCSAEETGCGDGYVCGTETCDGTNLVGEDCTTLAAIYAGGTLGCDGSCTWDMSGCIRSGSLTWVPLPGGTFQMGSTSGHGNETPVHAVTLPAFELLATEVTVSQYAACVTAGACTAPNTGGFCSWDASGYEDHPVNCVDWHQARAFCAWAGGRLPTEAEWEYAARSCGPSSSYPYPWGTAVATCTYAVMDDTTHAEGCGTNRTWAVCSKPAGNTAQGLCDMAGNVWEWVEDDWHGDYTGSPADGSAWMDSPRGSGRVLRGGGFSNVADGLRAALRNVDYPSAEAGYLGFRCAKDTP